MNREWLRFIRVGIVVVLGGCGGAVGVPILQPAPPPSGEFELLGRGPITETHTSDLWVFQGVDGRDYAYVGTFGDCTGCLGNRLYVWDVTDRTRPTLTDSVTVDAKVINAVMVDDAATVAVLGREQAPSRRNGMLILDIADPAHPKVLTDYWETVTGGVHNLFIDGELVYVVHTGTGDMHVIDISDPRQPRETGRWGVPGYEGKYLSDVWVEDGIAYLSYWNDGLMLVDVGNGIESGTPSGPKFISQYRYRTEVDDDRYGNTAMAVPYTNRAGNRYVFVADHILPRGFDPSGSDRVQPRGYVHVVDISNLQKPREVGRYEVPQAGVHSLWAEDDILYTAYHNGGLRAVDISGELSGELRSQGRELAVLPTIATRAFVPGRALTFGVQAHEEAVFATDFNSGLWVARLLAQRPSP